MKHRYSFILLCILFFCSCHKENTGMIAPGSVIIVNEGNFQHGNADLSVYNPSAKTVSNNVFSIENGFTLGDVAQDLYLLNDTAYIVINNSQNIVIANAANNFKYIDTIYLPGSSPRYFLPVGGSKAYVTELYANKIWVVDFRRRILLNTIPVSGWTEQLVSWGGYIYVQEQTQAFTGSPTHAVLMIDPNNDQIVSSIALRSDPGSMALTSANKLFVLCPMDTPGYSASLYRIDMPSFSIDKEVNFGPTRTPNLIRYSSYSNQLLYTDSGGIFVMQPADTALPAAPFIPSQGWNVYGLNTNPANGDIYISDAVDYQQASHVWRFSQAGVLEDHFTSGIITNGFVFE